MPAIKRKSTEVTMAKRPSLRRETTLTLASSDDGSVRSSSSIRRKSSNLSMRSSSSVTSLKRKATLVSEGSGIYSSVVALESGSSVGKTGSLKVASVGKDCDVIPVSLPLSKKGSVSKTAAAVNTLHESVLMETTSPMKSSLSKKKSSLVREPSLTKASLSKRKSSVPDLNAAIDSTSSPPLPPGGLIEIAISFDTTGSMYGYLEEVRGRVKDMIQRLQADIPGIRIAIIAHGDYCDAAKYIVKWIDFGASVPELCEFVETVERTSGGDADECYELVLRRTREVLSWTPGSQRSLVVIGDCLPHEVGYTYDGFVNDIDWHVEAQELNKMLVKIYSVCVNPNPLRMHFYNEIATVTGGRLIPLDKFGVLFDMLMSICYKESGSDLFEAYEREVRGREGRTMDTALDGMFTTLGGKKSSFKGKKSSFKFSPPLMLPASPSPPGIPLMPLTTAGMIPIRTAATSKAKTARKPSKNNTKKSKKSKTRGKVGGRFIRESLTDAQFTTGPLKRLMWSKWMLGISKTQFAKAIGHDISLIRREWCDAFCNQAILKREDVNGVPAVYEFAVRLAGKRKLYPVFYRVTTGVPQGSNWFNYLLSQKRVRNAIKDVMNTHSEIMVRKGQFKTKRSAFIKNVSQTIFNKYDYAWVGRGDRKMKFRNLKRCGVRISSDAY